MSCSKIINSFENKKVRNYVIVNTAIIHKYDFIGMMEKLNIFK